MKSTQWIGAGLGIVILVLSIVLTPLEPLTHLGMKTLGVFLFTVLWWISVGLGFSSFLCIALFAITGVMTSDEALASSLGSWLPVFLIACFGLTEAISHSGFSRRFALWFITRPFVAGHPWMLVAMLLLSCTIMGSMMSSTVTTIIFMSIAVPMLEALGYKKGDDLAAMLIMGIGWASAASALITPIGHGANLMCMEWIYRDTGYFMSFPGWLAVGIPMGLLVYLLLMVVFRYVVRPDVAKISGAATEFVRTEAGKLGPVKIEEKLSLGVFFVVVLAWMLPGTANGILPEVAGYLKNIGFVVPAIVGSVLLCLIRVRNEPLLTFRRWMAGTEWGSVILCAAIMAIGSVIGKPETGIPDFLASIIQPIMGAPFIIVVFVGILWVILQTNIMSNIVSATLVYTVMMPAVVAAGVGNAAALGYTIFAGCHYAFVLPSATTVTAIVVGSGWVPVKFMARYGIIMIIPTILLFAFVCYPFASFIYR